MASSTIEKSSMKGGGFTHIVGAEMASVLPRWSKPWFLQPELLRLNIYVFIAMLSATSLGFESSMMNGLQSLSTWNVYFNDPSGALLGLMNAVMHIAIVLTAPLGGWMSNKIGRRYTIIIGTVIILIASALQGASQNIAMFIISRFIVGIGSELCCVAAPALISEIAYPTHRGKVTSLYFCCYYLGSISSSWITFGSFHMTNSTWSWRIPSILQAFFPLIQLFGLFFVPESPRWLFSVGRADEARNILATYHAAGDDSHPLVDFEMQEISSRIQMEGEAAKIGVSSLWKTKADRKRLAITVFTAFIGQWSGNGVLTYYLSIILNSVGITSSFDKTLINGILQIFNFIVAILGSLLVDKIGRRRLWLFGFSGMFVSYIIFTATSASFIDTQSKSTGLAVVVFIFVYSFHYDIAVTPLIISYVTEIQPFYNRQRGLAVATSCSALALTFNTFVNPIALDAIAWKYYIVYVVLLPLQLLVIYLFYPETKGYPLEEIADIFNGPTIVAGAFNKNKRVVDEEDGDKKEAQTVMIEDVKAD